MLTLLLTLLVACGDSDGSSGSGGVDGANGQQGEQGPQGEQGLQGLPGVDANAAYRWVDADGVEVSPNPSLYIIDDDGWVWAISPYTGDSPRCTGVESGIHYYEDADCSGREIVATLNYPRHIFCVADDSAYWTRPDDLPFDSVCPASSSVNGVCQAHNYCSFQYALLDDLVRLPNLQPPASWRGPLHQER